MIISDISKLQSRQWSRIGCISTHNDSSRLGSLVFFRVNWSVQNTWRALVEKISAFQANKIVL